MPAHKLTTDRPFCRSMLMSRGHENARIYSRAKFEAKHQTDLTIFPTNLTIRMLGLGNLTVE